MGQQGGERAAGFVQGEAPEGWLGIQVDFLELEDLEPALKAQGRCNGTVRGQREAFGALASKD